MPPEDFRDGRPSLSQAVLKLLHTKTAGIFRRVADSPVKTTATQFVERLVIEEGIPRSVIWYHLNELKRVGLIHFADAREKGLALSLTTVGSTIVEETWHRKI